jgi:hypothetical protein
VALLLHPADNVATLPFGCPAGAAAVRVMGPGAEGDLPVRTPIQPGHKVAVRPIVPGEPVIKYGHPIGHATAPIAAGEWVHVHNLASSRATKAGEPGGL